VYAVEQSKIQDFVSIL